MDSLDQCIVNACKNSWDKSYLAGTPNKDNCSGFVQSVAAELGVPMPRGNANAMVDGLEQSWTKLASGAEAAQKAAQGFLVIAGLKGRTYGTSRWSSAVRCIGRSTRCAGAAASPARSARARA